LEAITATEHLRFAPEILRRLGEELIPSPDQGILELVRNAYDADAAECTVELLQGEGGGEVVVVTDNGDGMDLDDIRSGWLILGRSVKSPRLPTSKGRIPAGDKGLGRLSALRLGRSAVLTTRPAADLGVEYQVELNWDDFDAASTVEEVPIRIERLVSSTPSSGTVILIRDMRERLGKQDVRKLARALLLMADPFESKTAFRPRLVAAEFAELEKRVREGYFEEADYRIHADLDAHGHSKVVVFDWRNQPLYTGSHDEVSSDHRPYDAPATQFDLWVFLLGRSSFMQRKAPVAEIRSWLGAVGGVHLYHRGLRVRPYGDPGHDWLDMNLRRVRSPEERPSTNTSIGRVTVPDPDERLVQKTDRTGFVENDAFRELRRFATDALEWAATRRLEAAEARRRKERDQTHAELDTASQRLAESVAHLNDDQPGIRSAVATYQRAVSRELHSLREDLLLYRTLGTVGTSSATFAHEAVKPVEQIQKSASLVKSRGTKLLGDDYQQIAKLVERVLNAARSLRTFVRLPLALLQRDKRRAGRVRVQQVVGDLLELFDPFLVDAKVSVTVEASAEDAAVYGTTSAVESILANLLINSVNAFVSPRMGPGQRQVVIRVQAPDDQILLSILDSGPGIEGIRLSDVWLPGRTTLPGGTGLGLTIVRDAVLDLGGEVSAIAHGELGGAEFHVVLPRLSS
jgi:signal transduction histidine kinase